MGNDILNKHSAELRKLPYSVPDGYFDGLEDRLADIAASSRVKLSPVKKFMPYISMAAAFLLLVTAGTFILERSIRSGSMTYEDYVVYSDMELDLEPDSEELHIIENKVEAEDIIEYLIYIGATAEVIEQSN